MPIYEPDLSYEDMKKALHTFKCAVCSNHLTLAWSAQQNSYMLRCGKVLEHEGVVPLGRDPELLEIANKLKGRPLPMETKELKKQTKETMLARVDMAKFPKDLTRADRALIATVALEYGLDPLFGELMIYQGRPYVTIDARRRKAQETEKLDGISARPATKQERVARRVPDEDYLFVAEVWVRGASHPFEGWGRVKESETKGDPHLPVVKDPAAQAEKRAEAQGLRRGFHLPLPSFEEIIEGEFTDITPRGEVTNSKSSPPKAPARPAPPTTSNRLTPAQRTKIWGDASKMGYTEDEVHTIIAAKWGAKSINDLTVPQASDFIGMIQRGEGLPPPGTDKSGDDLEDYEKG